MGEQYKAEKIGEYMLRPVEDDSDPYTLVTRGKNHQYVAEFMKRSDARLFVNAERAMDLIQEIALGGGDRAKKARAILRDEGRAE